MTQMKNSLRSLLLAAALTLCVAGGAQAQTYVSIAALHDQAQAMGGAWRQTIDTPNGALTVDVPILVPDIETLPVLTVEPAKPLTPALFEEIAQGVRTKASAASKPLQYEIERDGETVEFFMGYEENGLTGYDAVEYMWIQHGAYRFSQGADNAGSAKPVTYHYPWQLDLNAPLVRGSELTANDVMRQWRADIAMAYPNAEYDIRPKRIMLKGSLLAENEGTDKASRRDGKYDVVAEQYVGGVPVFGAISSNDAENHFRISYTSSKNTNREEDKLNGYRTGSSRARIDLRAFSTSEADYRTMTCLDNVRSVEMADIPLAPLDDVLAGVTREIEAGRIQAIYSVRLGYLLYSDPEMTDYAWAIPRWVVDCAYVTRENEASVRFFREHNDGTMNPWEAYEFLQMPIDAQSGEPILMTIGSAEDFRVPELVSWDEAQ